MVLGAPRKERYRCPSVFCFELCLVASPEFATQIAGIDGRRARQALETLRETWAGRFQRSAAVGPSQRGPRPGRVPGKQSPSQHNPTHPGQHTSQDHHGEFTGPRHVCRTPRPLPPRDHLTPPSHHSTSPPRPTSHLTPSPSSSAYSRVSSKNGSGSRRVGGWWREYQCRRW